MSTPPLIAHCESHLGPIVTGWVDDENGTRLPFQVAEFAKSPIDGASVLCTLGLSKIPLRVGDSTRRLRQELVMMFRDADGRRNLPAILQQVGMKAIELDLACYPGDVIGPKNALQAGASVSALYVTLPVYLPDSFQVCHEESTVFAWLVPITKSEADFVRARGRDEFENALEAADPDLLDFSREGIV